jgi:WD40 repeat protein
MKMKGFHFYHRMICGLILASMLPFRANAGTEEQKPRILTKSTHYLGDLFYGSFDFSPDGESFVCVGEGYAHQWSTRTGKKLRAFDKQPYVYSGGVIEKDDGPYSARFSPDGKTLASTSDRVRIWDTKTGQVRRVLNVSASDAVYSPNGQIIAVAESHFRVDKDMIGDVIKPDDTISLWRVATGEKIHSLHRKEGVRLLGFWRNGKSILIQRESQGKLEEWELKTGKFRPVNLPNRGNDQERFVVSERGNWLAMVNYPEAKRGAEIEIYDFTPKRIKVIRPMNNGFCLAASADGKMLAIGGTGHYNHEASISLYDTKSWHEVYRIMGDPGELALSHNGRWLAVGDMGKDITLWKLPK